MSASGKGRAVLKQIEFRLNEIDSEIEMIPGATLDDIDRWILKRHADDMRTIIAFARLRTATHELTELVAQNDPSLVRDIGRGNERNFTIGGVGSLATIAS